MIEGAVHSIALAGRRPRGTVDKLFEVEPELLSDFACIVKLTLY